MIPWQSNDMLHKRFYHIFTKKELKNIITQSGFVIEKLSYKTKEGKTTDNRKDANNTLLIAKKNIFIP
ncbi:TPA: hypothetical protein DIC40_05515 [Patescibacteria group bacterium]|nr:hypothetical protein [Candidatus Gracilibacteria bacterium]